MSPVERLAALRAALVAAGVDGLLVPRADEHLGEYVPPSGERLAWLTGFTGSAGLAIVLADRAALFTDGRYTTQAAQQLDPALWALRHITEQPAAAWLGDHAAGKRIGYDPWLHSEAALARLQPAGVTLVPLPVNPIDTAWADRPPPPLTPAVPHPLAVAGQDQAAKRVAAAGLLTAEGEDAAVLADSHSLAWLFNIRGSDLAHTPLALGFALLHADATAELFMAPEKLSAATRTHLGNAVTTRPLSALPAALAALAGRRVRVDPETTPAWFAERLRAADATVIAGEDPTRLPRLRKNAVEQAGAHAAHQRDAVAMARFLHWLQGAALNGETTEMMAADQLLACRRDQPMFQAESFPAISGAGEHGAIIHYRATPESDRIIRAWEAYLIDSGGQYLDGTTDVTRTIWTGPGPAPEPLRERYTRVLQGHIALSALRFPEGLAGPFLDAVARTALWQAGLDYDHGTGHGVGSFLSVHEGPIAFSRAARPLPLQPGMILSNEPGYYLPGQYGIRIENLLLVRAAAAQADQVKPFLEFETLTLVPYDRALIATALLSPAERAWIQSYHARVYAEVAPLCDPPVREWLRIAILPLD
jgi:Xaa-Pro aminopeptidase